MIDVKSRCNEMTPVDQIDLVGKSRQTRAHNQQSQTPIHNACKNTFIGNSESRKMARDKIKAIKCPLE